MLEQELIRKQKNRAKNEQIKFVRDVLTPQNPRDMYYFNVEQRIESYMMMVFIGVIMIMFLVFH